MYQDLAHSHSLPAGLLPSSPEEPDKHTGRGASYILLHSLTSHQCSYPCLSLECPCQVNIAFLLPTGTAQTGECIVQHETLLTIMDVDAFFCHTKRGGGGERPRGGEEGGNG